jgi:hypothetical protein
MVDIAKVTGFIRKNGVGIGLEVLVNFIGPLLIYDLGKRSLGDVHALIASSAPPIAWSVFEFARRRRIDALSLFVLAGIALSLLAFIGGGGVHFLQLREKLVTAVIGLIFLGSVLIGRPLIYEIARARLRRRSDSEAEAFEALRDNVHFRRTMAVMTLVWGVGLILEAAVAGALVFVLTIHDFLMVGPMVGYGVLGSLSLWTFWYVQRARRRGDARRAAEALALKAESEGAAV